TLAPGSSLRVGGADAVGAGALAGCASRSSLWLTRSPLRKRSSGGGGVSTGAFRFRRPAASEPPALEPEDHVLVDVLDVVAEPLEVARHRRELGGARDGTRVGQHV